MAASTGHQTYSSVNLDSEDESGRKLQETSILGSDSEETDALLDTGDGTDDAYKVDWDWRHIVKVISGAGIGSLLEFYSFGLVAYFEPELKASFFPPSTGDETALLEEFTLYGIAFAMRPFGGLVFGYIGDRYGRVYSLRISLFAMMVPTVLYAVLPNYSAIGVTSTVLVFIFRVLQGLSCGGEMSTALVYIFEEAPSNMKATLLGYLMAMSCGSYLALIAYALWDSSSSVESESTWDWTWRLAFASSIVVGIFGVYMRRLLPNSHEFDHIASSQAVLQNPISEVFRNFFEEFMVLFLAYIAFPVMYYSAAVWVPAFLSSNLSAVSNDYAYDVALLCGALGITFVALSGWIADRVGVFKFVLCTMVAAAVNIIVCYTVMSFTASIVLVSCCQIALSLNAFGGMGGVIWCAMWIPDARIRNTLTGITYNLGMALFVSTLFDVQTYLSGTSADLGAMYAGLYVAALVILSTGAIVYGQKCHSWQDYHFRAPRNPHLEAVQETDDEYHEI